MIPPDREIHEVEQRIALRRTQVARHAREAGSRAIQRLASPVSLLAAAAFGFLAASAVTKRQQKPPHPERRRSDHTKAAKATGLAGMLLPAAMWIVRAQWGSPAGAAQSLLKKLSQKKALPSLRGDRRRAAVRLVR